MGGIALNRYDIQMIINRSDKYPVIKFLYGLGLDNGFEVIFDSREGIYYLFVGEVVSNIHGVGDTLIRFLLEDDGEVESIISRLRECFGNIDIGIGYSGNGKKYVMIMEESTINMLSGNGLYVLDSRIRERLAHFYNGEDIYRGMVKFLLLYIKDFDKFLKVLELIKSSNN